LEPEKFINKSYLETKIKKEIQKTIEDDSEIALVEFLQDDFYGKICEELNGKDLKWRIKNPAHQNFYEYLDVKDFLGSLKMLFDLFSSSKMFQYLYEITELDLYGKQSKKPTFYGEIQRWSGGNYTLIGDQASFTDSTLDLILYFGENENIGVVTYLTPEENDSDVDPVLLTICPRPNALNVIYRSEGTTKFTKYVTKTVGKNKHNFMLVLSYKE
jgi:phosphatidylinositol glycan class S